MDSFSNESGPDESYAQMKDLVSEWQEECPDDCDMTLAYITVNIPYLSDERIHELLESLESQSICDEDNHERIYDECRRALEIRNIDLKDYLEE